MRRKNIVQFECRLKNHVLYIISYSLDPNILPEYCKYTNKCTHTQGWEPALDIWSSIYYYCLPSLKNLEVSICSDTHFCFENQQQFFFSFQTYNQMKDLLILILPVHQEIQYKLSRCHCSLYAPILLWIYVLPVFLSEKWS